MMHYEVELHEPTYEDDSTVLGVTGLSWSVRVLRSDDVPIPLTFDALCAAQAYVGRNQPGAVRIVQVADDGEREVVETS